MAMNQGSRHEEKMKNIEAFEFPIGVVQEVIPEEKQSGKRVICVKMIRMTKPSL